MRGIGRGGRGDGMSSKRMGQRDEVRRNEEGRGGGVMREWNSVTWRWEREGEGAQEWYWLLISEGSHSPTSRFMGAWAVGGSASSYARFVYFTSSSLACANTEAEFSHRPLPGLC